MCTIVEKLYVEIRNLLPCIVFVQLFFASESIQTVVQSVAFFNGRSLKLNEDVSIIKNVISKVHQIEFTVHQCLKFQNITLRNRKPKNARWY